MGLITSRASACNVPVFRYALERWQPDNYQLIVFYRGELTAEQTAAIEALRSQSLTRDGGLNLEVITADANAKLEDDLAAVWKTAKDRASLPWGIFRAAPVRGQRRVIWQGKLSEFDPQPWFHSPLRKKLLERLLAGDSGVWLVFPGDDADETKKMAALLERESERLGDELPFPEGIGEPGSEVYSPIPLTIRFSVLEAKPQEEVELLKLFGTLANIEVDATGPFAVPIFGRGRALEAFPAKLVTKDLIEEVSLFFTGACSCQVKQANPGFDLPLFADWMPLLFKDLLPPPEETKDALAREGKPEYVPIPKGRLADPPSDSLQGVRDRTKADSASAGSSDEGQTKSSPASPTNQGEARSEGIDDPTAPSVVARGPQGRLPLMARWTSLVAITLGGALIIAAFRR